MSARMAKPASSVPRIEPDARVLVQGATGRMGRKHTALMRAYGTRIVAGVAQSGAHEVDGVAVFDTCAAAVKATGASASVAFVPPLSVLPAIEEAVAAGIRLIVTVAEGVPVADAVRALVLARSAGVRWIGPSTPGLAIPGRRTKLGFLPDVALAPGRLGVMAKSGTLSYEVCHRLVKRGLGQSLWLGVGGDAVKGTRFADVLPLLQDDPGTDAIVVVGEIGGNEEEELASAMAALPCTKPVYALIAGQTAKEGITMGHAGALVFAGAGTMQSKRRALEGAGARVFTRIQELVDAVSSASGK